jgi:hypothetical protein
MFPSLLPSPNLTQNVDYQCFKQTKEQKSDIIAAKWQHKKYMEKHGINSRKFLNIPEHRLDKSIIITT